MTTLNEDLLALETTTFEIVDIADAGTDLADLMAGAAIVTAADGWCSSSCSTSSCCSCSTSSCCSSSTSSGCGGG